jgi:hypothetical protein
VKFMSVKKKTSRGRMRGADNLESCLSTVYPNGGRYNHKRRCCRTEEKYVVCEKSCSLLKLSPEELIKRLKSAVQQPLILISIPSLS